METLGVDAGNSNIKVVGENGERIIPSALGEYRERKLHQDFSKDDIEYEYSGKKGFAGTLAQYESQLLSSQMGISKAHEEMLIRVLIGICQYSQESQFRIVVGQPIARHTKGDKLKMKSLLQKEHEIVINGVRRTINIINAEVGAEGGSAFWSNPSKGIVRIVDFGSGTVNAATLDEGRYIDKDSFTIPYGMDTLLNDDYSAFSRKISQYALRLWSKEDKVVLCGGGAERMLPYLKEYFSNVEVLHPKINKERSDGIVIGKQLDQIYANAVGYYNIAKKVFNNEK